MVIPQNLKVTLNAPDGSHWTSFWQPVYLDKFLPGGRTARVTFAIPPSLYERLKPLPLRVHLDLALEQGRASGTNTISIPLDEFRIPGFATCAPLTGISYRPDQIGEMLRILKLRGASGAACGNGPSSTPCEVRYRGASSDLVFDQRGTVSVPSSIFRLHEGDFVPVQDYDEKSYDDFDAAHADAPWDPEARCGAK